MNRLCLIFPTLLLLNKTVAAQTWQVTSAPSEVWTGVACSSDGGTVYAAANVRYDFPPPGEGQVYLSTDSGATWGMRSNTFCNCNYTFWDIACSAAGTTAFACTGGAGLWSSTNSASTWSGLSGPASPSILSVACSSDGSRAIAPVQVSGGKPTPIFVTTNAGVTWGTVTNGPSVNWKSAAMSSDGSVMFLGALSGQIYKSTDYGLSWKATNGLTADWYGLACSADGMKVVACALGNPLYVSTNSGAAWTTISGTTGKSWRSVACSADGQRLAAVAYNDATYFSLDGGITWAPIAGSTDRWERIACSADGVKWYAVTGDFSNNGWIYALTLPLLRIAPSGGGFAVSWPSSLAGYSLYQCDAISSSGWTRVTDPVHVTNGLAQVFVSPTASKRFYQLLPSSYGP